jgi:hypothetical protein
MPMTADNAFSELKKNLDAAKGQAFGSNSAASPDTTAMESNPVLTAVASAPQSASPFTPPVPRTLEETGLTSILLEELTLKLLLGKGAMAGREVATDLCLHFAVTEKILSELKTRLLVTHKASGDVGDFIYMLTESGQEKALIAREISAYSGSAPVAFADYLRGIQAQSIRNEKIHASVLQNAFADMIFDTSLFDTIGPALNSGRGLFLYGEPGNGKTSIAERLAGCFQNDIFIPRSIYVEGQILQLFDPQTHQPVPDDGESLIAKFDARWIKIRRPAVMVGGELTMDALDIKYNPILRVSEAPLQMKANGGVFLIDDFGRQRISHVELLNRWIVPLEKRVDFLVLPNGQKIQVPFDELIIFSTNLDPKSLVDDAFLRRIPYKIHVKDPEETQFKRIFQLLCGKYGIVFDEGPLAYLIQRHYQEKRPFRGCQPRDILEQVLNTSAYRNEPPQLTNEILDMACRNYFAAMGQE